MGTFRLSNGKRIKKSVLDDRIKKAKEEYSENFITEHGYIFCERCRDNSCKGVSRSHIISVNECQNSSRSELAYDLDNLEHLGIKEHMEIESWSHEKREAWYWARKYRITYKEFIEDYENDN